MDVYGLKLKKYMKNTINKTVALSLLYDSAEQGYKQAIIMSKQIAKKNKESKIMHQK